MQRSGMNLHTWMGLKATAPCTGGVGSYTSISYPANAAFVTNQVTLTLQVQQPLPFSSMFIEHRAGDPGDRQGGYDLVAEPLVSRRLKPTATCRDHQ